MINFIDLFCGIGGIRLGMEQAGFKCLMSADKDENCRKSYLANFGEMPEGDITNLDTTGIPNHDILCAGFPCQPFSIAGSKRGFDDTRGTLFFDICRIIDNKRPSVILLENVKYLIKHDKGNTLNVIINSLKELGYNVSWKLLNATDFGIPQNRERIIIVCSYKELPKFDFDKIKTNSVKDMRSILDRDGDFTYLNPSEYTLIDNPIRQQSGLIFAGYRNKTIRNGVNPDKKHLSRVHRQPNRIYSVLGIHPTLNSQEISGRYFILTEDNRVRKLTLNECYKLMGFPDDFKRIGSISTQYRQLGNSVCIPMIKAVAEEIKNQFF